MSRFLRSFPCERSFNPIHCIIYYNQYVKCHYALFLGALASNSLILADVLLPPSSLSANPFLRPPTVFVVSFVGRGVEIFGRRRKRWREEADGGAASAYPIQVGVRRQRRTSHIQTAIHSCSYSSLYRPVIQAGTRRLQTSFMAARWPLSLPPPLRWNQVRVIFSSHYLPFRSSYSPPLGTKLLILGDVIRHNELAVCFSK